MATQLQKYYKAPSAASFSRALAKHMHGSAQLPHSKEAHVLQRDEALDEAFAAQWGNTDARTFDALNYHFYDASVLDAQVQLLGAALESCLQRYPAEQVLYNDDIY